MTRDNEQVLELSSELTLEQQVQIEEDLNRDIDHDPWLGSTHNASSENHQHTSSEAMIEPIDQKKIKGKKRWYRPTEFDLHNFIAITSKDKSSDEKISEKDIDYLWRCLQECKGSQFIDEAILIGDTIPAPILLTLGGAIPISKKIVNAFSDAGKLAAYIPLWALQALCYAIENGQLSTILTVIARPPYHGNQKKLLNEYKKALTTEISLTAAIAFCYITNRNTGLPDSVQHILQLHLQQPYSIQPHKIHPSFVTSRETDLKKIRSRIFIGLLTAVKSGCHLNEQTFTLVKDSLLYIETRPQDYLPADKKEQKTPDGKGEYWKFQATYKSEAQQGKLLTVGDFYYIYQYINQNDSISCIWALFYALAGNNQSLPLSGFISKHNLVATQKKLASYLIIPLKDQHKPSARELQFSAACALCCMPDFKSDADLKQCLTIFDRFLNTGRDEHYIEWQNYAMIAMYYAAMLNMLNLELSDRFLHLLNKHLNSIRTHAANLIEVYIDKQIPRSSSAAGYIPSIENETMNILLKHRESDDSDLTAAAVGAVNIILEHQHHYPEIKLDFNLLESDILDAKKCHRVSLTILGKVKTNNMVNIVLFSNLCEALVRQDIDERTKENIVNILTHIIKNDVDGSCAAPKLLNSSTLKAIWHRILKNPQQSVNSRVLYEYGRGLGQRKPSPFYQLSKITETLPRLIAIFPDNKYSKPIKEDCFSLLLQAVKKGWRLDDKSIDVFTKLIQREDELYLRILNILSHVAKHHQFPKELITCLINKISSKDYQLQHTAFLLFRKYIHEKGNERTLSNEHILTLSQFLINQSSFYYANNILVKIIILYRQSIEIDALEAIIKAIGQFDDLEMSFSATKLLTQAVHTSHVNYILFVKICDMLIKAVYDGQRESVEHLLEAIYTVSLKNSDYLIEYEKENKSNTEKIHQKMFLAFPDILANSNLKEKSREIIYLFYKRNPNYLTHIPVEILSKDIVHINDLVATACLESIKSLLEDNHGMDQSKYKKIIEQLIKIINRHQLTETVLKLLLTIVKFPVSDIQIPKQLINFCHENLYEEDERYLEISFKILIELSKKQEEVLILPGLKQENAARENIQKIRHDKSKIDSSLISKFADEAKNNKKLTRTALQLIFDCANYSLESKQDTGIEINILDALQYIAANTQKIMHGAHDFLKTCLINKIYYYRTITVILQATKMQEELADDLLKQIEKNISLDLNEEIMTILKLETIRGKQLSIETINVLNKIINDPGSHPDGIVENTIFILKYSENYNNEPPKNDLVINALFEILKDKSKSDLHKHVFSILKHKQAKGHIKDKSIVFYIKIKKIFYQYHEANLEKKIKILKKLDLSEIKEIKTIRSKSHLEVIEDLLINALSINNIELTALSLKILFDQKFVSRKIFSGLFDLFPDKITLDHCHTVLNLLQKIDLDKLLTKLDGPLLKLFSYKLKYFISKSKHPKLSPQALDILELLNNHIHTLKHPSINNEYRENETIILLNKNPKKVIKLSDGLSKIKTLAEKGWFFSECLINLLAIQKVLTNELIDFFLILMKNGYQLNDNVLNRLAGHCLFDHKENSQSIQFIMYAESHRRIVPELKLLPPLLTDNKTTKFLYALLEKIPISDKLFTSILYLVMPYLEKNPKNLHHPVLQKLYLEDKSNTIEFAFIGFCYLQKNLGSIFLSEQKRQHSESEKMEIINLHLLKLLEKFKSKSIGDLITGSHLQSIYTKIIEKTALNTAELRICKFILFYNIAIQKVRYTENLEIINNSITKILEIHGNSLNDNALEAMIFLTKLINSYSCNDGALNNILFYLKTDLPCFLHQIYLQASNKDEYLHKVKMVWMRYKCSLPLIESAYSEYESIQQQLKTIIELLNKLEDKLDLNCLDILFNFVNKKTASQTQSDLEYLIKVLTLYQEETESSIHDLFHEIIENNSQTLSRKNIFELYRFIESAYILCHCGIIESESEHEDEFYLDERFDVVMGLLDLNWTRTDLIEIHQILTKIHLSKGYDHFLLGNIFQMLVNYRISSQHTERISEIFTSDKDNIFNELHRLVIQLNFDNQIQERSVPELLEKFAFKNKSHQNLLKFVTPILEQSPKILSGDFTINALDEKRKIKEWKNHDFSSWATIMRKRLSTDSNLHLDEWVEFLAVLNKAVEIHTTKEIIFKKEKLSGFKLRPAQMLTILCLLLDDDINRLGQMATSQGKSIIIAVVAVFKAFKGHVDIIVNSPIYAEQGVNEFTDFYRLFNLEVRHNIDKTHQNVIIGVKDCYAKHIDIVYGETGQFQFDLLRHEFKKHDTRGERRFDFSIVDEADSNMLDDRGKLARLSETIPAFDQLGPIYMLIWLHLNNILDEVTQYQKRNNSLENLEKKHEITDAKSESDESNYKDIVNQLLEDEKNTLPTLQKYFRKLIFEQLNLNEQADEKKELNNSNRNSNTLLIPRHLHGFIRWQTPRWVESAYTVWKEFRYDVHYVTIKDSFGVLRIAPLDHLSTGVTQHNTHWGDGIHQFLQLKEGLPLTPEGLTTNFISNITFFNRYRSLVGLTATLGREPEHTLFKSLYQNKKLDCVIFPSFSRKRLIQYKNRFFDTEDHWLSAIAESSIQQAKFDRAVLIITASIELAKKIYERNKKDYENLTLYIRSDYNNTISNRLINAREIIIATNLAGRALDLKLTPEALANGGLHLVLASPSINGRVYQQAIGRTARGGNSGTFQIMFHDPTLRLGERSFDRILQDQAEEEARQYSKFTKEQLSIIVKKGLLFTKFCHLRDKILQQIDESSNYHTLDFAKKHTVTIHKEILHASLIERWALWFKMVDDYDDADFEFAKFEKIVFKDVENDQLIKNPCYLLQEANHLIDYLETWWHTITQLSSYRQFIHNRIIQNCQSVDDPLFLSQAASIQAYDILRQEIPHNKKQAKDQFLKAIDLIETVNVPQILTMQSLIRYAETKKISINRELDKQITGKISVYSVVTNSLERAIQAIDRSRKLITVVSSTGSQVIQNTIPSIIHHLKGLESKESTPVNLIFQDLRVVYDLASTLRDEPFTVIKQAYALNVGNNLQVIFNDLLSTAALELIISAEGINLISLEKRDLEIKETINRLSRYQTLPLVDLTIQCITDNLSENINKVLQKLDFKDHVEKNHKKFHFFKKTSEKLLSLLRELDSSENSTLRFDLTINNLTIFQCKHEVSDDKNSKLSSLIFNFTSESQATKVVEILYKKIDTALIKLNLISIETAIKILNPISLEDEKLQRVKPIAIHKVFTDSYQRPEISQLIANGQKYIYEINEKLPFKKYSFLLVGGIAAAQILTGALIVTLAPYTVFGFGVGVGLICDGIGDVVSLVQIGVTGDFNWKFYMASKAVSIAFTLITAGFSALSTAAAKNAATAGKQTGIAASKVGSEIAEEMGMEVVQRSVMTTTNTVSTVTRAVAQESIKVCAELAKQGISYVFTQEDFTRLEDLIRQEVLRFVNHTLEKDWDLPLQRHFAYTKVCDLTEIEDRLAREIKAIACTVTYQRRFVSKNSPMTKIQLLASVATIVEPIFKDYGSEVSRLVHDYHSKATIQRALLDANELLSENIETILSFLKTCHIITAEGYLRKDIIFTYEERSDLSQLENPKINMDELDWPETLVPCKELVINVCKRFYQFLYGDKMPEIRLEIDKFKEIAFSTLIEQIKSLIIAHIHQMASQLISLAAASAAASVSGKPSIKKLSANTAKKVNNLTAVLNKSYALTKGGVEQLGKYYFLFMPPSKFPAHSKRSIIRMHGIKDERLQHVSADAQLSPTTTPEQEEKLNRHYGISKGDIPGPLRDLFDSLLESNLSYIKHILENPQGIHKNIPIQLFLLILILRTVLPHPIKAYFAYDYLQANPEYNLSSSIIKNEIITLLKKDIIWKVISQLANRIHQFPKILSHVLRKDYTIEDKAINLAEFFDLEIKFLDPVKPEARQKYIELLERESGDNIDGYLTKEPLELIKKLLMSSQFIEQFRLSLDSLSQGNRFIETLLDLLNCSVDLIDSKTVAHEVNFFLREKGFIYAQRLIRENTEFCRESDFKHEQTYQAMIEKYGLVEHDLQLIFSVAANLLLKPQILKKSYLYYRKSQHANFIMSLFLNISQNPEFSRMLKNHYNEVHTVILKMINQFSFNLGDRPSEFQLIKVVIKEFLLNLIFIGFPSPLNVHESSEFEATQQNIAVILGFNKFVDHLSAMHLAESTQIPFSIQLMKTHPQEMKLFVKLYLLNCYTDCFKQFIILVSKNNQLRRLLVTERGSISSITHAYIIHNTNLSTYQIDFNKSINELLSHEILWIVVASFLQSKWLHFFLELPQFIFHIFYRTSLMKTCVNYFIYPLKPKALKDSPTDLKHEVTVERSVVNHLINVVTFQSFLLENKQIHTQEIQSLRAMLSTLFDRSKSPAPLMHQIAQCAQKFLHFQPEDIGKPIIGVLDKLGLVDHSSSQISATSMLMMHIFASRRHPNELPKLIILMSVGFHVERLLFPKKPVKSKDRLLINRVVNERAQNKSLLDITKERMQFTQMIADSLAPSFSISWKQKALSLILIKLSGLNRSAESQKTTNSSTEEKKHQAPEIPADNKSTGVTSQPTHPGKSLKTTAASAEEKKHQAPEIPTNNKSIRVNSQPITSPPLLPLNAKYFFENGRLIPFTQEKIAGNGNCMFASIARGIEECLKPAIANEIRRQLIQKNKLNHECKHLNEHDLRHVVVKQLNEQANEAKLASQLVNHGLIPLLMLDPEQLRHIKEIIRANDPTKQLEARFESACENNKTSKGLSENIESWAKLYRDLLSLPGMWGGTPELIQLENLCEIRLNMRQQLNLENRRKVQLGKLKELIQNEQKNQEKPYLKRIKSHLNAALIHFFEIKESKSSQQTLTKEFGSDIEKLISAQQLNKDQLQDFIETPRAVELFYQWFCRKKVWHSDELEEDVYLQCLADKYRARNGLSLEMLKSITEKRIAIEEVYLPYDELDRAQRLQQVNEEKQLAVIYTGNHYDLVKPIPGAQPIALITPRISASPFGVMSGASNRNVHEITPTNSTSYQ